MTKINDREIFNCFRVQKNERNYYSKRTVAFLISDVACLIFSIQIRTIYLDKYAIFC